MEQLLSALAQGFIWAPMGLGIFVSFRILREADLTAEASFTLGAAAGAFALSQGVHPLLAVLISFLFGAAAGAITGLLITQLHIQPLLAGIISMTGLYSINLRILGQANVSFTRFTTYRTLLSGLGLARNVDTILMGVMVCLILIMLLSVFFQTRAGQALIATGDNAVMARSIGIETDGMKMLGFMLANGLVAISGILVAQDNGFADISMGVGTVVLGLAAVILGEVLFRNVSLPARLAAIVPGSMLYRILLMLVLQLRFDPQNFKLFSAVVLALCLGIPEVRARILGRRLAGDASAASGTGRGVRAGKEAAAAAQLAAEQGSVPRANGDLGAAPAGPAPVGLAAAPATTANALLDLRGLDKTFATGGEGTLHALDHLDLTVFPGDFVTMIGSNGAGKSTLLNAIAGQFSLDAGDVLLDGERINALSEAERAADIARIFQDPKLGTAPRMTVAENLALAEHRGEARGLTPAITEEDRARYAAALAQVNLGLENRLDTEISLLSGGQRQAVALLMATLKKPKLLLLDEHTAALDPKTQQVILAFTQKTIAENGLTALMITHNLEDALRYGNRMIALDHGRIRREFDAKEKAALRAVDVFEILGAFGGEL